MTALNAVRRGRELSRLADGARIDLVVIGGGITGAGIALDAASRGLSVVLAEKHDLAFGTSRWSSKLVHGGLRYLASGNVGIARRSAVERGILMTRSAPGARHAATGATAAGDGPRSAGAGASRFRRRGRPASARRHPGVGASPIAPCQRRSGGGHGARRAPRGPRRRAARLRRPAHRRRPAGRGGGPNGRRPRRDDPDPGLCVVGDRDLGRAHRRTQRRVAECERVR